MMNIAWKMTLIFCLGVSGIWGCKKNGGTVPRAEIAVSSSYLHAAAKEFLPNENIFCLSAPGMCPGHWDMSPQMLEELGHCRILFRFDFQKGMDGALERFRSRGLNIEAVHAGEGLCLPDTYLDVCRQVGKSLNNEIANETLLRIQQRLADLKQNIHDRMKEKGLSGSAVLCSHHQAAFSRWLGLRVLGEFGGGDDATPAEIQTCLEGVKDQPVRFIIANRAQGTELARSLSEKLHAEMVVFDNFPEQADTPGAFDRTLWNNVAALLGN